MRIAQIAPLWERVPPPAYGGTEDVDIIHSHIDYAALPYATFSQTPVVHTLHGIFTPLTEQIFAQHKSQNFVSISQSQRRPELGLNYVDTVYNAIAIDSFDFFATPDEPPYLAFLGRMSVEKGPHLAIEIAKRSGIPLKMAGKIDFENRDFFEREVEPYIDGKHITFIGEADH